MSHNLGAHAVGLRLGSRDRSAGKGAFMDRSKDVRLVGLIKDYTRIHHRAPFVPGFTAAFRLLLLVRVFSAMYSGISDCDETFNYWEPLHLITHPPSPHGTSQAPFQTWEYSPQFAIRSWAYIAQYVPIAGWLIQALGREKVSAFFATRILLAFTSALCEASLTTAVAEVVNSRVAKYMLIMLLCSAGMYESSTALLPSTFTMYTTTLALSYAFYPSRSGGKHFPFNNNLAYTPPHRTLITTMVFALGALVGWPFALLLSIPFVVEEVFLSSGLLVPAHRYTQFILTRLLHWSRAIFIASLIAIPLLLIDTLAYARVTLVPLNIIVYNILSSRRGAGPELYGTEPWYYYLLNLSLNFGPALPLALLSIPALLFTAWYEPRRFAAIEAVKVEGKGHTGPGKAKGTTELAMLLFRLAPLYLWLGLLTLQPHKEERFMFPAYPLLCFNAAVTLCLARGWMERCFIDATKSSYRASKSYLFTIATSSVILFTALFSLSRILHTAQSYHAPVSLLNHLSYQELPRVVAAVWPSEQSKLVQERMARGLHPVLTPDELSASSSRREYESSGIEKEAPNVDLRRLVGLGENGTEALRLCYGKEWFRYPTTFLVPDGVSIDFVKSDFDGILPKHFARQSLDYKRLHGLDDALGWMWPWKDMTRAVPAGFNDMNREEADQYVEIGTCDYLIDVDYPARRDPSSALEPRHVIDSAQWTQVKCLPFLDSGDSHARVRSRLTGRIRATLDRVVWLPGFMRGDTNQYGDYCLLRTTRTDSLANRTM
ncbi:hypothetical protein CBS101457_004685 [Exobasidium rhododendri]|nr:hypothetical protein CBS101457_004685 [Exobasidium rhododendri]